MVISSHVMADAGCIQALGKGDPGPVERVLHHMISFPAARVRAAPAAWLTHHEKDRQ